MRAGRFPLLAAFLTLLPAASRAADVAPHVLASIRPVHSIAAAVMAGAGTPELLLAGGASPHSYALKPSDARKLARAEIVFWIGPALEAFLSAPLRSLAADARIVELMAAPGLRRLPVRTGGLWEDERGHEGPDDAHVWLDPENGAAMARAMAGALGNADPDRAGLYRENAEDFAQAMTALDEAIEERLAPVRERPYLVFHDAYQYFGTRYGLSPQGAVTVAPDRPAGTRRVVEMRTRIRATPAICVFTPAQFPPRLIATLTEGAEAKTASLDELGTELMPGPGLYEALLRRLADGFADCLGA